MGLSEKNESRSPPAWRFHAYAAVALLAGGYLTVAGCLNAPLTAYDDAIQIVRNPLLTPEHGWLELFTTPCNQQYAPLSFLSLKLNYAVFGREAYWSFRAANWLLHSAGGMALFLLLVGIGLRKTEALFVALAWTAHPMACESTAWAIERRGCLAFLFGAAGLLAYTKWHGTWRGTLGGAAGLLLSVMSKHAGLGWFPVFVAVELVGGPGRLAEQDGRSAADGRSAGSSRLAGAARAAARLAPPAAISAIFAVVSAFQARHGVMEPPGGHWHTALMTDTGIFARYVFNILIPARLSAFYCVEPIASFGDARLYAYGTLLAALVAGSVLTARSRRMAVFGWLWFFGSLGPNWNLVGTPFPMQDRYAHIAAAGLLLVAVETAAGLLARVSKGEASRVARSAAAIGACLYVLCLAALATARGADWASTYVLFRKSVETEPRSAWARMQYGQALANNARVFETQGPACAAQAGESSEAALDQYSAAVSCPDLDRFLFPMSVRLLIAREAVSLGRAEQAMGALEGVLPPPAPPGGAEAGLSPEDLAAGIRLMAVAGRTRLYYTEDLALGWYLVAEAGLLKADRLGLPPEQALDRLDRAAECCRKAISAMPELDAPYYTLGKALLMREAARASEGEEAGAAERIERARRAARRAEPCLKVFAGSPQFRFFAPPVPEGRPLAVARLALAEADLQEALDAGAAGEDAARRALSLAEQAIADDRTFADAQGFAARCHLALARIERDGKAKALHVERAREAIGRCDPASPVRRSAEAMLKDIAGN